MEFEVGIICFKLKANHPWYKHESSFFLVHPAMK